MITSESKIRDVDKRAIMSCFILVQYQNLRIVRLQSFAVNLQSQCQPARQLNELLDAILDPLKPIDMWDTVDWCRWLMAGGKTPDEFANTGKNVFKHKFSS